MSTYGVPQVVTTDDITDRIGIRTLTLAVNWQAGENLSQAQVDAATPATPEVPGGLLLIGKQTRNMGGFFRTSWTFEGINGDGKSVTFQDRLHTYDYGFEPGFSQVSVQLNSKFQKIADAFGGTWDPEGGMVVWTENLGAATTGSGTTKNAASTATTNPMFGMQDWFRMEGNYRVRYAAKTLPPSLFNIVGFIADPPSMPGTPPALKDGRNWLYAPPQWKKRGYVYDITEIYWLSGPGGWPAPLYDYATWSKL